MNKNNSFYIIIIIVLSTLLLLNINNKDNKSDKTAIDNNSKISNDNASIPAPAPAVALPPLPTATTQDLVPQCDSKESEANVGNLISSLSNSFIHYELVDLENIKEIDKSEDGKTRVCNAIATLNRGGKIKIYYRYYPNARGDSTLSELQQVYQLTHNPWPIKHTSNKKITSVVATCLMLAAQNYNIPPAVMLAIMHVEGGAVGQETGPDSNSNYKLGPMQISSSNVPELAKFWQVDNKTAYQMLKNDVCININVSAWILRKHLNETGNLTLAIAHYHSLINSEGYPYARKVVEAMKNMDLIKN